MKQLLSFIFILTFISTGYFQNTYKNLWQEVDSLEAKDLPKSALKVIDEIAKRAKTEASTIQYIKTLFYKNKHALTLEENAALKIISDFEAEAKTLAFPEKQFLHSILASLYWDYFKNNRYKFYERSDVDTNSTDFRTWSLNTLFKKIDYHYSASLEPKLKLQEVDLSTFDVLLITEKYSKVFRPTLYDFLAHRALDFYKTPETVITKPKDAFSLNNPDFFSTAKTFSNLTFPEFPNEPVLKALRIYQNLIAFHIQSGNALALADVNNKRLNYVYDRFVGSNKDELLNTALTQEAELATKYAAGIYKLSRAKHLYNLGQTFDTFYNTNYQWDIKKAYQILETITEDSTHPITYKNVMLLKADIKAKTLELQIEGYLPINTFAPVLIGYKNINALNFNLFKLSDKHYKSWSALTELTDKLKFIKTLSSYNHWTQPLKTLGDFQTHFTEAVIPKLENSSYLLMVSDVDSTNIKAFQTFNVTNIAVTKTTDDYKNAFQVFSRKNGQPLIGAKVTLTAAQSPFQVLKIYTTNEIGEIYPESVKNVSQINLLVEYKSDRAYFDNFYLNQSSPPPITKVNLKASLFTDRSIYKPGQTVYFKSIVYNDKQVLNNEKLSVELYNTNNKVVAKQTFTTNEFGSIAGQFILPDFGLNGQYQIKLSGTNSPLMAYTYVLVEDYKRPKFKAEFEPITANFKVNQTINIQGNARAFAGYPLPNAKVRYRVTRQTRLPFWYFWKRPYYQNIQEIANGEVLTDKNGEFIIPFQAVPDLNIKPSDQPIFNYVINADVTDINGETQTVSTTVNVGYHSLETSIDVNSSLKSTNEDAKINIITENLNGEFVAAEGTLTIYKLIAPKNPLRERDWLTPDLQVLTEAVYKDYFPNHPYLNEDDPNYWPKGKVVFQETINTSQTKSVALNNIKNWEPGLYQIEWTAKDAFNTVITSKAITTVYNPDAKRATDNSWLEIYTDRESYSPMQTTNIAFKTTLKNIYVTVDIARQNGTETTQIISLNANSKSLSLPISEADYGGITITAYITAFNEIKLMREHINVPYPETDLKIETLTFRDLLKPNSNETWQFKITGPKGELVTAEVLASMYDASLDEFVKHQWEFNPVNQINNINYHSRYFHYSFNTRSFYIVNSGIKTGLIAQAYDALNWFGLSLRDFYFRNTIIVEEYETAEEITVNEITINETSLQSDGAKKQTASMPEDDLAPEKIKTDLPIRQNFNETAFFYPKLKTNAEGEVHFSFTAPEALTRWKFQLLAHDASLKSKLLTLNTVTQKELMVVPNIPRFLREGDTLLLSTKVVNLTEKPQNGFVSLQLFDALTGKDISSVMLLNPGEYKFDISAQNSTEQTWQIYVPHTVQAVNYRLIAKSDKFSDGEQNFLPVLSNRKLVTETLPLWVGPESTKSFTFNKLLEQQSPTLKHHKLSFDITTNPAWEAIQALPYLIEQDYELNTQLFERYYANSIAQYILAKNKNIEATFKQWKSKDVLLSDLEKNQDLKAIILSQTPWLRDAETEAEQKKRIALLFDLNQVSQQLNVTAKQLANNQLNNGSYSWYGETPNRFITQYIIAGLGHLSAIQDELSPELTKTISEALNYLDTAFLETYKTDVKLEKSDANIPFIQLHYLYLRSFFKDITLAKEEQLARDYYLLKIKNNWTDYSLYAKGLMSIISYRNGDIKTASAILKSLKETSIVSEEMGMYWKSNTNSLYWTQAAIETQALLIEAFLEIAEDESTANLLKIWLLKQKQTQHWNSTKATTNAIYAILLGKSNPVQTSKADISAIEVTIGKQPIDITSEAEAGTGYFKKNWLGNEVSKDLANVSIKNPTNNTIWGGLYWQYFENLDKITSAETQLKLEKTLYLKQNTNQGEQLIKITPETDINVGDIIRVRIHIYNDRDMEFVFLEDMRAAGLEPTTTLSTYKYQDGLGYYQSTKDAATHFYFDNLPKGVYVLEYDLRVNNKGTMSNGISTLQSLYAPEFSSHSQGERITID